MTSKSPLHRHRALEVARPRDYSHASTGAFWMVQNSRGDQPSPGLGAGEERI